MVGQREGEAFKTRNRFTVLLIIVFSLASPGLLTSRLCLLTTVTKNITNLVSFRAKPNDIFQLGQLPAVNENLESKIDVCFSILYNTFFKINFGWRYRLRGKSRNV